MEGEQANNEGERFSHPSDAHAVHPKVQLRDSTRCLLRKSCQTHSIMHARLTVRLPPQSLTHVRFIPRVASPNRWRFCTIHHDQRPAASPRSRYRTPQNSRIGLTLCCCSLFACRRNSSAHALPRATGMAWTEPRKLSGSKGRNPLGWSRGCSMFDSAQIPRIHFHSPLSEPGLQAGLPSTLPDSPHSVRGSTAQTGNYRIGVI